MKCLMSLLMVGLMATAAGADLIGSEDFDGGAVNLTGTTNVFDRGAGGGTLGDVFGRCSQYAGGAGTGGPYEVFDDTVTDTSGGGVYPGDYLGIAGQNSTAFFAMNDMDGADGPGLNDAVWTFDVSTMISLTNITIDIAAMGDFEASSTDGFLIEARIDAGAYLEIFKGRTDEAAYKTYRLMDDGVTAFADDDPLELSIDGTATGIYLDKCVAATGDFDSYTSIALAGGSGSTLDIRVSWAGTPSGSEPMGFDNFTINGTVPEPTSLALLAIGGLAILRRRR